MISPKDNATVNSPSPESFSFPCGAREKEGCAWVAPEEAPALTHQELHMRPRGTNWLPTRSFGNTLRQIKRPNRRGSARAQKTSPKNGALAIIAWRTLRPVHQRKDAKIWRFSKSMPRDTVRKETSFKGTLASKRLQESRHFLWKRRFARKNTRSPRPGSGRPFTHEIVGKGQS